MARLRRTARLGMSEEHRALRRHSIGGSDARIIMSGDQDAIEHLWRQKRGEIPLDDLSGSLLVQMGVVLEPLIVDFFEHETGMFVSGEQTRCTDEEWAVATCTLDGFVSRTEGGEIVGINETKFMMPFGWDRDAAVAKYMPQMQHNLCVTGYDTGWFGIATGAAVFVHVEVEADPLYQACQRSILQEFWHCVETGRIPGTPRIEAPRPDAIRVVDMSASNSWAAYAATMLETADACDRHEAAKKAIKEVMPDDAREASGHGVTITRSKTGRRTIKLDEAALEEARRRVETLSTAA